MVLGIKEYPCQIDSEELDTLIDFIDGMKYQDNPIVTKTEDNFLDNFEKLKWSFYDACSRYWDMDVFNYRMNSWVYVDWNGNPNEPYMHAHNSENPYTLSGIMFLRFTKSSGTTMFPLPGGDRYFLPSKMLTWFIFPSNLPHIPGRGMDNEKRYTLSADLYYG